LVTVNFVGFIVHSDHPAARPSSLTRLPGCIEFDAADVPATAVTIFVRGASHLDVSVFCRQNAKL